MTSFSTPRGTQDILPEEWPYWRYVQGHAERVAVQYGYKRIETPTLGDTELFARTSGESSDVVRKEMYSFRDQGGDDLTLRPEGTAPVMRAYLQHGMQKLPQPVKLFYLERMYRREKPQKGRLREHHQFGCEAIGSEDPFVDAEMIDLLNTLYGRLGLVDFSLHINSIGDRVCRPGYVEALTQYLRRHEEALDPTDRDRLGRNPLRVLDSKEERSQEVIAGAPAMAGYLCADCEAHWQTVQHALRCLHIDFVVDNRLVRGLDYYTRTVFEFLPGEARAQGTLGAGGRYDALAEAMGAGPVPGIGFGSGIERLILALSEAAIDVPPDPPLHAFLAHVGPAAADASIALAHDLRSAGLAVGLGTRGRSLKAQLRHANASGARYAVIVGDDEIVSRTAQVKPLQESGEQEAVPFAELGARLARSRSSSDSF